MLSVRSLAADTGLPPHSVKALTHALAGPGQTLRAAFAGRALRIAYARRKGFSSYLGLPLNPDGQARDTPLPSHIDGRYAGRFRSGTLLLTAALDGEAEARDTHEASIELVALECRNKQEKTDEVVGSAASIRPSDKTSRIVSIPKLSMGQRGQRIVTFSEVVYQGAFANVAIACSLIEKDSGDTSKYRAAVAKEIQKAATMGGAAAGVSSEDLAGGEDWMRLVSVGLSNIIFDLLGADDDQFNPQVLTILQKEMTDRKEGRLPELVLERGDDPRRVRYTHRVIVSGTDGGGDEGEYGFYFMLRTRPRPEVEQDFE